MRKADSFEDYLSQHPKWHEGIILLRELILDVGMKETIKWGAPTYTFNNTNLVSIGAFKNHLALWIFNGSSLIDKANVLVKVQDSTKNMRHLRYHHHDEINSEIVKSYCLETIDNLKLNKIKKIKRSKIVLTLPNELLIVLEDNPALKDAYEKLSLSKRKEYATFISEAKQAATKQRRLDKIVPMIMALQGLNDKYR